MAKDTWSCEHFTEIAASAGTVWDAFKDVAAWPQWNAGIERIELTGAFETGATFTMTVPGQSPLTTRLIDVREGDRFVDETVVGDLTIIVAHLIQPAANGHTKVVYALTATGSGCDEIGPAVSSDFPEVLAGLKAFAEAHAAR